MAPETQVRRIIVKFDTQGDKDLNNIKNSLASMNKEVKKTSDAVQSFQSVFQSILGASFLGVGISSITNLADTYQKLGDRIKVFEGSQEKANETMANIAVVADRTKSSIEDVATVYSRLSLSLKETGITSGSLLFITEQLQNSFRLSGSTAAEATASVVQLSQGLASGQLRGQELRSVLEQNAVFGGLLAEKLGIARGALLKYAEAAGGIKSKTVIEAILLGSEKLNSEAKLLGVTFSEATQKGLNKFTVALGELNKEFGVSAAYSKFIDILADNLTILAGVALGLAVTALPLLITQLELMAVAFLANPVTAIVAGLVAGITYAIVETDRFVGSMLKLRFVILEAVGSATEGFFTLAKAIANVTSLGNGSLLDDYFDAGIQGGKKFKEESAKNFEEVTKSFEQNEKARAAVANLGVKTFEQQQNALRKELEKTLKFGGGDKSGKPLTLKKQLEELNASFNDGKIDVSTYNSKLIDLTDRMSDKKGPLNKFKEMSKVLKENLGREFEYGLITLQEYTAALKNLEALQLEEAFRRGAISVDEYHKKIIETSDDLQPGSAIYTGTAEYIKSVGTLSQNVAGVVTGVFNKLEDALVEFTKNGKLSFKDFANAVIEDINRVIIRSLIVKPLAEGILNFAGSAFASSATGTGGTGSANSVANTPNAGFQALGGAWENGVQKFASGGIVNRTTPFGMAGGKTGIMGEAGPEAIIPLRRNGKGELGISGGSGGGSNVQVNIINNAGVDIEQKETKNSNGDRALDVIITAKVKEAFNSGAMDRQMSSQYGLRRRGV